ncbi:hypothetical protein ACQKOM_25085 [Peribacillus frigoritolerans]|uniref:hypothetical protein n=1 Tax=Peribacillus frigoritolerans TaxID=450367 RepID=UPI003D075989
MKESLKEQVKAPENQDFLLNILFGVSGGLLSLIGLIAIFISINSQHNIDKAKEIIWELRRLSKRVTKVKWELTNSEQNLNFKMYELIWNYKNSIKANRIQKIIVMIAILTIIFISTNWFFLLKWNPVKALEEYVWVNVIIYGSLFLMLCFIVSLGLLLKLPLMGGIPSMKTFTRLTTTIEGIDMAKLLAFSSYLSIEEGYEQNTFKLWVHYPYTFSKVKLITNFTIKSLDKDEIIDQQDYSFDELSTSNVGTINIKDLTGQYDISLLQGLVTVNFIILHRDRHRQYSLRRNTNKTITFKFPFKDLHNKNPYKQKFPYHDVSNMLIAGDEVHLFSLMENQEKDYI